MIEMSIGDVCFEPISLLTDWLAWPIWLGPVRAAAASTAASASPARHVGQRFETLILACNDIKIGIKHFF